MIRHVPLFARASNNSDCVRGRCEVVRLAVLGLVQQVVRQVTLVRIHHEDDPWRVVHTVVLHVQTVVVGIVAFAGNVGIVVYIAG